MEGKYMYKRKVTNIRLSSPGTHPAHITDFKFVDQNSKYWQCTRDQMVTFVRLNPGTAYTLVNGIRANLRVVAHWVETYPDSTKKDNLLSLPPF
jgi:hypothetical protein